LPWLMTPVLVMRAAAPRAASPSIPRRVNGSAVDCRVD
jgi:hypothetical protein